MGRCSTIRPAARTCGPVIVPDPADSSIPGNRTRGPACPAAQWPCRYPGGRPPRRPGPASRRSTGGRQNGHPRGQCPRRRSAATSPPSRFVHPLAAAGLFTFRWLRHGYGVLSQVSFSWNTILLEYDLWPCLLWPPPSNVQLMPTAQCEGTATTNRRIVVKGPRRSMSVCGCRGMWGVGKFSVFSFQFSVLGGLGARMPGRSAAAGLRRPRTDWSSGV